MVESRSSSMKWRCLCLNVLSGEVADIHPPQIPTLKTGNAFARSLVLKMSMDHEDRLPSGEIAGSFVTYWLALWNEYIYLSCVLTCRPADGARSATRRSPATARRRSRSRNPASGPTRCSSWPRSRWRHRSARSTSADSPAMSPMTDHPRTVFCRRKRMAV